MRRNANGQDEPRGERASAPCAKLAKTKRSRTERLRGEQLGTLRSGAVVVPQGNRRSHPRDAEAAVATRPTLGRVLARTGMFIALIVAVVGASDVSARFAPFDRKDRPAAALAGGSATIAAADANDAHSSVMDADLASADVVPGIPDASARLQEQIRIAKALDSTMPAAYDGDPSMKTGDADGTDDPAAASDPGMVTDPALKTTPYESDAPAQHAPARSKSAPNGSRNQETIDPESADSGVPSQSLAWLGLFGVAGAGLTWWLSRRRAGRAVSPGSLSPAEVRAALAEIAASKRGDLGRPDLSVITRSSSPAIRAAHDQSTHTPSVHTPSVHTPLVHTPSTHTRSIHAPSGRFLRAAKTAPTALAADRSGVPNITSDRPAPILANEFKAASILSHERKAASIESQRAVVPSASSTPAVASTPVTPNAGEDRLERIERSLLAFTGVVQALVESIPTRADQEKSSESTSSEGTLDSNGATNGATSPTTALGDGSSDHAAESAAEPARTEEDLASAWDCFLQSEGVQPKKSSRKRSSAASRIARQGRATRSTTERGNTQDESASPPAQNDSSTGQTVPSDPLHDLGRIREQVLDLAGRGVPTEQICRQVGLSSKEVGLILKSLFRANA